MIPVRAVVYLSPRLDDSLYAKLWSLLELVRLIPVKILDEGVPGAVAVSECRALVLEVPYAVTGELDRQTYAKLLNSCRSALDRGILVVFVVPNGHEYDEAVRDLYAKFKAKADAALPQRAWQFAPFLRKQEDVSDILNLCIEHWPGRALGDTHIQEEPSEALSDECHLLLKRAFNDFERVVASRLKPRDLKAGELPHEAVYRVQPYLAGRPLAIVFIVKFFLRSTRFNDEIGNIERFEGKTPFPYLPPVSPTRCVAGRSWVLLVSHFVDRAMQFERYIISHAPSMAIAALFDGPLRCWHVHATARRYSIGSYLQSKQIVRRSAEDYETAFSLATSRGQACRNPQALLAVVANSPEMDMHACMAHGDLHLGNLRVRDNTSEVVLIDFGRSETEAPLSRDPAELEVSLAFGPDDGATVRPLSDQELSLLFTPPLLQFHNLGRHASSRALAIEQIRRQVACLVSEAEYRLMVGGHCLWYASKRKWPEIAADAYLVADTLI